MTTSRFALAAGVMLGALSPLPAQQPTTPPAVLRIVREDIREGKEAAHQKSENTFMMEAARAKYPANILGLTSITGTSQAWFLESHDSFEAIGATLAAFDKPDADFAKIDELDAEFRSSSRSWIAIYRPDLSYHGQDLMQGLPKARFFNISMVRVANGHGQDFTELGRMAVDAATKTIDQQPLAVYQVVSGLPEGTFMLFEPTDSLKMLDSAQDRSQAMLQAMGDSGSKRFLKLAGDAIASEESLLFSVSPKMSYVSKEFAAGDPAFWNPPAEETKAPPVKPRAKVPPKTAAAK